MQKRLVLALVMLITCFGVRGQGSLIYHTSFEIDSSRYCEPKSFFSSDTNAALLENYYSNIFSALGSPDIFTPCDSLWVYSTQDSFYVRYPQTWPNNTFGSQNPYSGNNFIGLSNYATPFTNNYLREWIGIKLPQELVKDKFYLFEYYVNPIDEAGYFTPAPQISLTSDSIHRFNGALSNIDTASNPLNSIDISIGNLTIITDTINWTKISGIYKSNGYERFAYIGNFYSNLQTPRIKNWQYPYDSGNYYYIDDLSIYELDSTFVGTTENPANSIAVYPNPAADIFTVNTGALHNASVQLCDIQGRLLLQQNIINTATTIDVSSFASGVYVVSVLQNGVVVKRNKVVVSR